MSSPARLVTPVPCLSTGRCFWSVLLDVTDPVISRWEVHLFQDILLCQMLPPSCIDPLVDLLGAVH